MQSTVLRALITLVALAALGAATVACGGNGDNDKDAIEETIRAFEKAWNDKDYPAFAAAHTDNGLRAQLADSEEDLDTEEGRKAAFDTFAGDDKTVITKIGEITVNDKRATAKVEGYNESRTDPSPSSIVLGVDFTLVKESEDWKIDGLAFGSPGIPAGAKLIKVQANEFAFSLLDQPDGGDMYFEVENVGEQPHHVVIERVPDDLDIEAALQSEDEPQGLVHIGATPPWEPGATNTIVFTKALEPGRYVMLCFMPDTSDPEGTPHALKGMWKDFRVN